MSNKLLKEDLNKYTPRTEQKNAIEFIDKVEKNKKHNKFYLFNLPTGVGKSHLALMIVDYFKKKNSFTKADIITAGKILQDQYDTEYDSIFNLKGKDNYRCSQYDCSCAQGKEFNSINKTSCDDCPYTEARNNFIQEDISLTNFHLYLTYSVFAEKNENNIINQRNSRVLIVDECHELDTVMSDFISMKITPNVIDRLHLNSAELLKKKLVGVETKDEFMTYLDEVLKDLLHTKDSIENDMLSEPNKPFVTRRNNRLSNLNGTQNKDLNKLSILTDIEQLISKIDLFKGEYKNDKDNWVIERNKNDKSGNIEISMEPIWAYNYLNKYVWSKYDKVILISGTILEKSIFCELNGIDYNDSVYYSISSPFPLNNRKIYYMPLGKMTYDKKLDTFKSYVPFIEKILKKYDGQKGIIHTNSFELSSWIESHIKNERLVFHDASNKDEMLLKHMSTELPTVLVSPSVTTGVSFDHDKARFQIIAKIPYPSLASKKNKVRQKNNPQWYAFTTISKIIQSYGRVVRSSNDYGDTIIIDGSFGDILKFNSHLIPNWVMSAIKRIDVK